MTTTRTDTRSRPENNLSAVWVFWLQSFNRYHPISTGLLGAVWDYVKKKLWPWLSSALVDVFKEVSRPIWEDVLQPLVRGEYMEAYKALAGDVAAVLKGLDGLGVRVPEEYFKWVAAGNQRASAIHLVLSPWSDIIPKASGAEGLGRAWGMKQLEADLVLADMETPREFTGESTTGTETYRNYLEELSPDFPPVGQIETGDFELPEFVEPTPRVAPPPEEEEPKKKPPPKPKPEAERPPPKAEPGPGPPGPEERPPREEKPPPPEAKPPPPPEAKPPPPPRYHFPPPPDLPNRYLSLPYHVFAANLYGWTQILPSTEGIWGGIKDTWVVIKDVLLDLENWVTHAFQLSVNAIVEGLNNIIIYLTKYIDAGVQYIGDSLVYVGMTIEGIVSSVWDAMAKWISAGVDYVGGLFSTGLNWFGDLVELVWGSVQIYFNGFVEVLGNWIAAAGQSLAAVFGQGIENIYALFLELVDPIRTAIVSAALNIKSLVTESIPELIKDLKELPAAVWSGIATGVESFGGYIGAIAATVWSNILGLADYVVNQWGPETLDKIGQKLKPLEDWFQEIDRTVWNSVTSLPDLVKPMTPDKAPAAAMGLLGVAASAGFMSHALASAAELIHPLKSVGVHYMSAMVAQLSSFSTIGAATMGVFVINAIRQPFEYYIKDQFRPMIPDPMLLNMMRAKREINSADYNKYMGYQGFPDQMIAAMQRYLYMDPRLFEVIRISEVTSPPEVAPTEAIEWLARAGIIPDEPQNWWYYMKFGKGGYDDVDLPVLSQAAVLSIRRREQTLFLMRVREQFREYLLDEKEVRAYLEEAGLRADVAEWRLRAMKFERHFREVKEATGINITQYRNDVIDENELRLVLAGLGYLDPKIEIIIARENLRKSGQAAREVRAEEKYDLRRIQAVEIRLYRQRFKERMISADRYETYLLGLGLTPELARLTVELDKERYFDPPDIIALREAEKLEAELIREYRKIYIEQFRKGLIDRDALVNNLVLTNTQLELAEAIATYELARVGIEAS